MNDTSKKPLGLPDPLAPDSEKKSKEYGLKYAKVIAQEWFDNNGLISGSCNYLSRRDWIRGMRQLVRGEASMEDAKNLHKRNDNDLDYLNLDWSELNVTHKFCKVVANGIGDENYRLDVRAVDNYAAKLRQDVRQDYFKYMVSKKMREDAAKILGVKVYAPSNLPDDEEELDLQMQIKERLKPEIGEEITIDWIKKTNNWEYTEFKKNDDAVEIGLMVGRCWTDPNDGVKIEYVDPEKYIHSYTTKWDFSDKYYDGVIDTITIGDIKREAGDEFSDLDLRKIAKIHGANNTTHFIDYDKCIMDDVLNVRIPVLRFAFKTTKTIVYRKQMRKGYVAKMTKKDENYNPPERSDYGRASKTLDTWFEGNFILGSNFLYCYKECENLAKDVMNKALPPFITVATNIYNNRLRSFLSDIETPAKMLRQAHLKIQQLLAELKPDITEIDYDAIASIGEGEGGSKLENVKTALSLLNVKGVVLKKRIDMGEQGVKETRAVNVASTPQGSAIVIALNAWGHYYNLMRDISGINPAADGSLSQDALLGVSQLAQLATNTVTRNIVRAAIHFNKKVNETITSRIGLIYKSKDADHLKKIYNNAVGRHNIEALEAMESRHLHEFGFTLEMVPTQKDIQEFKEALNIALSNKAINVTDKIEAEAIARSNIKQAREYLKYRIKKNEKLAMEKEMMLSTHKSQNDAAAAQAAEEAKVQGYQFTKQIDVNVAQQLALIEVQKAQAIAEINVPAEERRFQQDVFLKKLDVMGSVQKETIKEDRKDDRTKIQATQQSKLIDQRQSNKPPIDFNNEDEFNKFLADTIGAL